MSAILDLRGKVTRTAWIVPSDFSRDEWRAAGLMLGKVESGVSWWLGDWWAFGEHCYGDRKAIVEAEDWAGPAYQTCKDNATVCRAIERSRRRDLLSFNHHAEVAALPPDEQDRLLDLAERNGLSVLKLRGEVSRRRNRIGLVPSPDGTCSVLDLHALATSGAKFSCIYADPPWAYDNQSTRAATSKHYGGLSIEHLCELPIKELAADAAHLHLWTTNAFLFDAPRIFAAWGFEFRSSFVWVKPSIGIGNYWRNSHEILLTAIRGDATRFNDHNLKSWIECGRGGHSSKPESIANMIERASGGPYLELFARWQREGWTCWGDEIEQDLFRANWPPREAA